jgi:phage-related protein
MREIGASCHELRVTDQTQSWRIVYATTADAVVVLDVFSKKTAKIPRSVVESCRARLKRYGETTRDPI